MMHNLQKQSNWFLDMAKNVKSNLPEDRIKIWTMLFCLHIATEHFEQTNARYPVAFAKEKLNPLIS